MLSVSVYKPKGRSRWMMAWRDDAGKLHRVSTGAKDKSVAKQIAREKERQLTLDPWGLTAKRATPILWTVLQEEFLALWLNLWVES